MITKLEFRKSYAALRMLLADAEEQQPEARND